MQAQVASNPIEIIDQVNRLRHRSSSKPEMNQIEKISTKESTFHSTLMSTPSFEEFQTDFRRNGWNIAGANLLSMSCWLARQHFIYVRPRLSPVDFALALVFALAVGSIVGIIAWACNPMRQEITTTWYASTIGFFIGSLSGIGYLLRKASHWQPMENIIRQLTRTQQRELVVVLVSVCTDLNIDPESSEALLSAPSTAEKDFPGHFVGTLLEFFRTRLKMQQ